MTNILIIDTETTGLKPADCQVIELAFILYNVETASELACASTLIHAPANPVEHINHISPASLEAVKSSVVPNLVINMFQLAEIEADFIIAHNAPFDKGFLDAHVCKTTKPWVDSKCDIKFPKQGTGNRLGYIAFDHGIPVVDAHRALNDCRILMALLKLVPDLADQLADTVGAKVYQAITTFDQKDLCKAAGFNWDAYGKVWKRRMSPSKVKDLPFQVKELPNG